MLKAIGQSVGRFKVEGVKPGYSMPQEGGESAFATITELSFPGKWKILHFHQTNLDRCVPGLVAYDNLVSDFADCDAVLLTGSMFDKSFIMTSLRERLRLSKVRHFQLSDQGNGPTSLIVQLGIVGTSDVIPATFIVDPQNVIQYLTATDDCDPAETLRVLVALQND